MVIRDLMKGRAEELIEVLDRLDSEVEIGYLIDDLTGRYSEQLHNCESYEDAAEQSRALGLANLASVYERAAERHRAIESASVHIAKRLGLDYGIGYCGVRVTPEVIESEWRGKTERHYIYPNLATLVYGEWKVQTAEIERGFARSRTVQPGDLCAECRSSRLRLAAEKRANARLAREMGF